MNQIGVCDLVTDFKLLFLLTRVTGNQIMSRQLTQSKQQQQQQNNKNNNNKKRILLVIGVTTDLNDYRFWLCHQASASFTRHLTCMSMPGC